MNTVSPACICRPQMTTHPYNVSKNAGFPAALKEDRLCLFRTDDRSIAQAVRCVVTEGIGVLRLEEHQMSLEDIFLSLTGRRVSL